MYCHIRFMKNGTSSVGRLGLHLLWRVRLLFFGKSWKRTIASSPLEPRTAATTDGYTQCQWWVMLWIPSVYASWQEQVTLPKMGSSSGSTPGPSELSPVECSLNVQASFHFYHLRPGVADYAGGMSSLDPSGSFSIPLCPCRLPGLWGTNRGMLLSVSCLTLAMGYIKMRWEERKG